MVRSSGFEFTVNLQTSEAPDQVPGTTNRTDRPSHRIAVVDGCRPNERTVALAIGSMDFSDSPHVTVGITNHHFTPAVAADGHIFEKGVHSAGPLGNLLGIHAKKAQFGAKSTCLTILQTGGPWIVLISVVRMQHHLDAQNA